MPLCLTSNLSAYFENSALHWKASYLCSVEWQQIDLKRKKEIPVMTIIIRKSGWYHQQLSYHVQTCHEVIECTTLCTCTTRGLYVTADLWSLRFCKGSDHNYVSQLRYRLFTYHKLHKSWKCFFFFMYRVIHQRKTNERNKARSSSYMNCFRSTLRQHFF